MYENDYKYLRAVNELFFYVVINLKLEKPENRRFL